MITQREIYLDSNATHPLLPSVRAGLARDLTSNEAVLSNPASIHRRGQQAKAAVAKFRDSLCRVLGRPDGDEFIFLSGATEAINLSLRGFVADRRSKGRTPFLIASTVEHKAILDTFAALDVEQALVGVSSEGQLISDELFDLVRKRLADEKTDILVCLQVANNETGVAFDLPQILAQLQVEHGPKALTHLPKIKGGKYPQSHQRVWVCLDAAQAFCKLPDSYIRQCLHYADYLALSAHKIGAAPGVGTLWLRSQAPFQAQITGGTQERKRRAGTLNSLGLRSFALALADWEQNGDSYRNTWQKLRAFIAQELEAIQGLVIHGQKKDGSLPAMPNTINFHVEGCPEESLLLSLDLDGFCLSSGSACNSGSLKPSHVLQAMGFSADRSLSAVRMSLGVESTLEDCRSFVEAVRAKVAQIHTARRKSSEMFEETTL